MPRRNAGPREDVLGAAVSLDRRRAGAEEQGIAEVDYDDNRTKRKKVFQE